MRLSEHVWTKTLLLPPLTSSTMPGGQGWTGVTPAGSATAPCSTLSPSPGSLAEGRTQCLGSGIMGSGIKIKADMTFSVSLQTSMVRVVFTTTL